MMPLSLHNLANKIQHEFESSLEFIAASTDSRLYLRDYFVAPRLSLGQGALATIKDLTASNVRALIVGEPGTGKTTLLKYLTLSFAENYQRDDKNPCPIYLRAHLIDYSSSNTKLVETIAEQISRYLGRLPDLEWVNDQLLAGKLVLLIDGLDEVLHSEKRVAFYSQVNDFARQYSKLPLILSSRPAALSIPFTEFTYYYIEGITKEQIWQFAHKRSVGRPEVADRFIDAIWSHRSLAVLAQSPLFLTVLWQLYEYRGALPTNRTSLYADCVDFLLSTWEHSKALSRNYLSINEKQELLEQISFQLLLDDRNTLTRDELTVAVTKSRIKISESKRLTDELLESGLLIQQSPDTIGFVHRSFLEYFSARAISKDPAKIPLLIAKRHLHETVIMSCGLLVDIAPIIESAVAQREVLLAAKCVSQARTKNLRLSQYVFKVLLDDLGTEFFQDLDEFRSMPIDAIHKPDQYEDLLYLWDRSFEEGLDSHTKGQRFESFAAKLFNCFAKVVRQDLRTENGELDLVCENVITTPFWQDYGGEFLVECKNWSNNVPIHEVGHFAHKAEMARGVRLAFFVSVSGFTEDARRMLRNQAVRDTGPLIVPLGGAEIKEAILKRDNIEDFFKETIRDIKFLRKF